MSSFVFAIPSYKRANKQVALEYLVSLGYTKKDIYISTQTEDDYQKYKEKYDKTANILFKKGVGVAHNRNTLLEHLPKNTRIIMIDDDTKAICRLTNKKIEPFTKDELEKFANKAFDMCEKNNALLWGGYPVNNHFFMSFKADKRNLLTGSLMGIINSDFLFDNDFKIKEDFDLCLRMIQKGFPVIRFNFVKSNAPQQTKGGCEEFWKQDTHYTNLLLERHSNLIERGTKKNSVKLKKWVKEV